MLIEIVHELRKAKGRNAKIRILKQHENNYLWKKALLYMYDTSKNYYVSAPSDYTFVSGIQDYSRMFQILDKLSTGEHRGRSAKLLAMEGSEKFGEIFRLILSGGLSCGVSTTTLNDLYDSFIPTFSVMLAEDSEVSAFPVLASTKYDGVRLVVFIKNGAVKPKTRSGKDLCLLSLIESMQIFPDGVYDGELVAGDGLQANRTGITGSVNSILKGSATDIEGYTFVIFDYISLDSWEIKLSTESYITRLGQLNDIAMPDMNIRIIENKELLNANDIELLYEDRIAKGYEGLILRYPNDPYVWCRSPALIKKKAIKECILKCVGVTEGTGKYSGMVGALICEGHVEGKDVQVKLGSGLSKYDVEQPSEYFVGRNVEALYNSVIKAENKQSYSLFLPRFKRVVGNMDI